MITDITLHIAIEKDIPLLQKDRVLKVDKLQNEISLHSVLPRARAHAMTPRALAHGIPLNTTHNNEIQPVLVLATIVNGRHNHPHSGQDDGKLMARANSIIEVNPLSDHVHHKEELVHRRYLCEIQGMRNLVLYPNDV